MSKSTKGKAGNKALQTENQTALKVFKQSAVKTTVIAIAAAKQDGAVADADRATHAMTFMTLAAQFIADANEKGVTDSSTQSENWVNNIKVMAKQLVADGHASAEALKDKDGNVSGHKLVGYPANVASIGKGVIEYGINILDVPRKDAEKDVSYNDVATAVKLERASRRPAEVIALAEAIQGARDAFEELLTLTRADDNVPVINTLTASLVAMTEEAKADIAEIVKLEAEIAAADAAKATDEQEAVAEAA